MQAQYDHICLTVGDIDRSVAFYERYFGLTPVRRDPLHGGEMVECMTGVEGGSLFAVFMANGHLVLELIQFVDGRGGNDMAAGANSVGCPHIGFSVEDVREVYSAWAAEGVRFQGPPVLSKRHLKWSAMMFDPDGIMIELREGPALSAEQMALAQN